MLPGEDKGGKGSVLLLLRYGVVQEEILRIVSALRRGGSRPVARQNGTCDGHDWQAVRTGDNQPGCGEGALCVTARYYDSRCISKRKGGRWRERGALASIRVCTKATVE